ncbi:MAG: putative toxin-antitoxin system toxin component, PIN family [Chloroflexi bacterium]|nr:putative toxin-antitoxin system toxin component, PIN family [Chloroflexota bacterium]MCC6894843.1 putative toxin-antitoxin system toxin component, PIN family [Anaerolineae bacterium]
MRIFVDTSVLFSAIFSPNGHARDLLNLAVDNILTLVISQDVLDETERNLQKKAPGKVLLFTTLITLLEPEIVQNLTVEEVAVAAVYTARKDAPIVAAAIKAGVDYLVTYDHKDLLDPSEVAANSV